MNNSYLMIAGIKIELTPEQTEILLQSVDEVKKKSVDEVKKKWSYFGKIEGYYINSNSVVEEFMDFNTNDKSRNVFPTKAEAEASIALSQLCQWRDKYNEGWKANWYNTNTKFCINIHQNKTNMINTPSISHILYFKSVEIRDKFLNDFKDLIEIAMPLL
jgi:hypothetical protein